MKHRVGLFRTGDSLEASLRHALDYVKVFDHIRPTTRVALKPNLTYPYHRPGITTSPAVIRETLKVLLDYTPNISVVETDGGYGAWKAEEAFSGHDLFDMQKQFGIQVVNLTTEPSEPIAFRSGFRRYLMPLPVRLLRETDLFITMPVPKIHCMTGLSLGYKNQWGCVPDPMRLRRHYIFEDAIVAINQALKPVVLSDGTYFLDRNGPMEGCPVRMDYIISATSVGAFDRYVSDLMGFPWPRVSHLRRAVALGDMPSDLAEIEANESPERARNHIFRLDRTLRNYVALCGFHSRFITWFGYESWFGRAVLHRILYAIAGRPVKPHPIAVDEPFLK